MALVDIPFPTGSMPGHRVGEGQGRLINVYCEVDGNVPTYRGVAGLTSFADTTINGPRGMFVYQNTRMFVAQRDACLVVSINGTATMVGSALPGSNPVTFAQNNRAPTPDLVCVTDVGAFLIGSNTITPYPSPNLPAPLDVTQMDGYLLFAISDGRIYASGLNDTAIDPLSFTTCQANPDGLMRGVAKGTYYFAFGSDSCEVFSDAATTPFPLARTTVIPVGLYGQWALTGYEAGWNGALYFIASDGTVCAMDGLSPAVISTKDVERDIAAISDRSSIKASVHVVSGNPFVTFSCPSWTWVYNTRTKLWHERRSYQSPRWRGEHSAKFNGNWIVGDAQGPALFKVSEDAFTENGAPIVWDMESGGLKQFPSRIQVAAAYFDFTRGAAPERGASVAVNPQVSISWSHDGGGVWSNPLVRSLGATGKFAERVTVRRLGLTTDHGIRFRIQTSAPVYLTFRGGRAEAAARAA